MEYLPTFGNTALTIAAFVVALSIIVAIHEYGHYIVGRWSGIHAEVYSLGFGPVLWSRHDKRGTKWQVAAIPLGGYVKFLGDANAASVGGDEEVPKARNTMLGAPLWARAATVAAGPIFNFVLAALIFAGVLIFNGQASGQLTVASVPDWPEDRAMELRAGDVVLSIDGQELSFDDSYGPLVDTLPSAPSLTYEVERDGQVIAVQGPHPVPTLAASISPRSAADDADLRVGDVILSMNGTEVFAFNDMVAIVDAVGGTPVALSVWRDGAIFETTITPRLLPQRQDDGSLRDEYKLGIGSVGVFFDPVTEPVGPLRALWLGTRNTWEVITGSIQGLGAMISGAINHCSLNSPVGIAEAAGSMASQGTMSFISFVAVLSAAVGLLNLFPIPILDGGHLMFYAYEAVTGRLPSDGALRIAMAIGLALIGTLMLFALANDLFLCP
ncbi:MAG: regulator of sigma E protease RseP [Rhodobacteraceae bacterium HLUCCA08]|nr:MAG: regulator of sigma E protease RseP [Rhodobacteraceae bacterium HLUCCA08]